jgi:hypothetical protein
MPKGNTSAMNDISSGGFADARPATADEVPVASAGQNAGIDNARDPIGVVLEIAGSGSNIALDLQRLQECAGDDDPSIALAGQVGSQIKIRVGNAWLLASVRTQRQDSKTPGGILAAIDFLGEGDEERLTGRIHGFRRGVTRYPIPGALIYPATSNDLKQIYASDGRANVQIGTVFPTRDIRAGLYIDAMLGKHFALLGSTGTGKSTSAALILHRICEAAPEGHIVMVDPHGEYSAAFKQTGQIFDVSNLQMPYWLMNFEEHCEVFLTTSGNDRQEDADILAKCLLQARGKNRLAETMGKITVDSPIPYLLSDLSNAIQTEMGKLDKAGSSAPYMRVKGKIDEIKADPRYQFMFSGMLVGDTMSEFIGKIFRLPSRGKPISIIDVSGVPSDITWSAKKPTATFPTRRTPTVPRSARFSAVSPRKAVSTVSRSASSPSVLRIWPRACCHSAARSSRCASTTIATRPSSRRRCPKARAGSSIRSPRFGTANASSAARAFRSRCASPSTTSTR